MRWDHLSSLKTPQSLLWSLMLKIGSSIGLVTSLDSLSAGSLAECKVIRGVLLVRNRRMTTQGIKRLRILQTTIPVIIQIRRRASDND